MPCSAAGSAVLPASPAKGVFRSCAPRAGDIGFVARGAGDLPALGGEPRRQVLRGEAEAEAEQPAHAASPIHSPLTAGSGRRRSARAQRAEALGREPRQRPYRHGAHQRRRVVELCLDQRGELRIAGIADGDQHIAQETVAARAFDRRAAKRARNAASSSTSSSASGGLALAALTASFASRALARICSTGRRRGNRRSRRCGCPWPRGNAARCVPCARW